MVKKPQGCRSARKLLFQRSLALELGNQDDSIQVTLVLRLSDNPLPNYCTELMDSSLDQNTIAITKRDNTSFGNGKGFRQDFREGKGAAAIEFIAVALEAAPVYVHFTSGYKMNKKQELRPISEKMVDTLTLKKS